MSLTTSARNTPAKTEQKTNTKRAVHELVSRPLFLYAFREVITMREYEDAYPEIFATFDDYEPPEDVAADVAMQRVEDVD